ncbi:MAG: alkaline phosphatase family protein [Sandaracinaceae bacterium]|nr:alkaline phosphatase family protein [Sandaracinaceae bacterium]
MTEEPPPDPREEPSASYRLAGVAALADRPVDERRVALVMGAVGLTLAIGCGALCETLLASANAEPEDAARLRALAPQGPRPPRPYGRLAVLLVDGLRVDEARAMASWRALAPEATVATARVALPSLSRPYYHHLFTGVSSDLSGVRSNRFEAPARFDSLMDRVRAAGGRVFFAADGLDWMRRMHGREGDGGDDRREGLGASLDATLAAWREAPVPALLVAHFVATDSTAHRGGIRSEAHLDALAAADEVAARIAAVPDAAFVLTSDHGHREPGGHGGDEPEVRSTPLLFRAPGVARGEQSPLPIDTDDLTLALALALGVPRPRAAVGRAPEALGGPGPDEPWPLHAASVATAVRGGALEALHERQRWLGPLALLAVVMLLGTIKRAYGFDRATPLALAGPALLVAAHAAWRPLSLSAIDERLPHAVRVVAAGALACARRGARLSRSARARACAARRAAASAGFRNNRGARRVPVACGAALGPWPLSAAAFYLPLLACGAGGGALLVAAAALLASAARR